MEPAVFLTALLIFVGIPALTVIKLARLRAGLALVQSAAVLQALDATAWHGPRRGNGGSEDAGGEAVSRAGAVHHPRLRDCGLRHSPWHQKLDLCDPLRPCSVDWIPSHPA